MTLIEDHPQRYNLTNELHARPFPALQPPGFAAFLAIKNPVDAVNRDRGVDRAHLLQLLDRFGAPHPQPDATHYFGDLGQFRLKWESHTEFVTYTVFGAGVADRPFDPAVFDVFPADWLAQAPGKRLTSVLIRVEELDDEQQVDTNLLSWLVRDSLCASRVLDDAAIVATDFRIDPAGHMRMAVFARPGTGERRIGRVVQRLTEIETYKAMAMLGLIRVSNMSARLGEIDRELAALVDHLGNNALAAEEGLSALLELSAELENLSTSSAFRLSATTAYEALVHQRIEALRETQFLGRQSFAEFMQRRFDPSMRRVKATRLHLNELAQEAARAGDLLRTRVDVERSAQNQKLLESMDRRAASQLRLQETVEGLSVVAISYYAVSLATYLLTPVAYHFGIDKSWLAAGLVLPVVGLVWLAGRRVRRRLNGG